MFSAPLKLYRLPKCCESIKNLASFMTSLALTPGNNDALPTCTLPSHSLLPLTTLYQAQAVMSRNMNRRPQYANVKLQCLNRIN